MLTIFNSGRHIRQSTKNRPKKCCYRSSQFAEPGEFEKTEPHRFFYSTDLVAEATRKQITDKGAFVKKAFSPTLNLSALDERIVSVAKQETAKKEAKQDIYYQFDEYIKTKERKVSKATLTVYSNVKGHLQAFEKYRQSF